MVKKYPLLLSHTNTHTRTHTHTVIQTQPHICHHKYRFIRYVHIGDDEQIFVGFWQIKALHLARFRKLVCKMNKTIWIFLYAIPQKKREHNYSEVRLWTQPAKSDSDFKNQARPKKNPVSDHQEGKVSRLVQFFFTFKFHCPEGKRGRQTDR